METIISYAGLAAILAGGWFCRKERIFIALATALAALFAAAIAMRYWWLLASEISSLLTFPPAELCFGCYWLLFGISYFLLLKFKEGVDERDTPKYPPFVNYVFVPLLMTVPFAVFLCGIMMSIQISLPEAWTSYNPADMPIRWDRVLIQGYKAVEQDVCKIPASDPAHTRFPKTVIPHGAPAEPLWE